MKKFIIVLQILVLLSQSVFADSTATTSTALEAQPEIVPQIPEKYKMPNMHLLDSVAFVNKYKDRNNQPVYVRGVVGKIQKYLHERKQVVQSYTGRYGATWGDDFLRRVYDIERTAQEPIEIVLTLSSTMNDAKAFRDRMALAGRKMMILEIPDHIQEHILNKAEAEAAGGIKELWFDTKDKVGKLINIKQTIEDSKKIIKNQFVAPSRSDIGLVAVSVTATITTTVLLATVGNVDPMLAASLGALRALIGGTALAYHRSLTNIFKSDIFNELKVTSLPRRVFTRLSVMGLGLGEFYYLIGSAVAGGNYGMTQKQIFTNTYTSGIVETLSSEERNNRLSTRANNNMILGHIIIGAAISSSAIVGKTGPLVYSSGIIEFSSLLVGTLALHTGFFFAYRYLSHHIEKIAQKDLIEAGIKKWERVISMRRAHAARIAKEQEARSLALVRRQEILSGTKERVQAARGHTCSSLFR